MAQTNESVAVTKFAIPRSIKFFLDKFSLKFESYGLAYWISVLLVINLSFISFFSVDVRAYYTSLDTGQMHKQMPRHVQAAFSHKYGRPRLILASTLEKNVLPQDLKLKS